MVTGLGDGVDDVHPVDHLAEDGVAPAGESRLRLLSAWLMKNCEVAEFGLLVRAIAMVPRTLLRPFFDSFLMSADTTASFSDQGAVADVLHAPRPGS